jgi:uncharacterized protein
MIVGIMSDTHDYMPLIRTAVERFIQAGVGAVIHAGDFMSPITFDCFKGLTVPFHAVFGNNDGEMAFLRKRFAPLGDIHERFHKVTLGNRRFVITHENDVVESLARSGDYDVVVHGHTHKTDVRRVGDTLIVNPGEVCGWLTGQCTAALLDTDSLEVTILDLR